MVYTALDWAVPALAVGGFLPLRLPLPGMFYTVSAFIFLDSALPIDIYVCVVYSKPARYGSPFAAQPTSSNNGYDNTRGSSGTPQRRGSNTSIGSIGSAGSGPGPSSSSNMNNNSGGYGYGSGSGSAGVRRSVGTASPLRASYSGGAGASSGIPAGNNSRPASPASFNSGSNNYNNSNSSSGVPAKRFSTPTPHDYDNNSNGNNPGSRPGSASSAGRNSTPSKATWRF